jgi:hypothetical protein
LKNINKTYLPFIVLAVVAGLLFLYDPPHSICENQLKSYRMSMIGKLYGRRVEKNIIPAKISDSVTRCKTGKTSGSCIDFFEIINEALTKLNQLDSECLPRLIEEPQIFENSKKFFLIINLLAWGEKVPVDNKENWLSQSNIFVYCKNKNFLKQIMEPDDFDSLVNRSIQSFPFEKLPFDFNEDSDEYINNKAIKKISAEEIISKSLMSLRCEGI